MTLKRYALDAVDLGITDARRAVPDTRRWLVAAHIRESYKPWQRTEPFVECRGFEAFVERFVKYFENRSDGLMLYACDALSRSVMDFLADSIQADLDAAAAARESSDEPNPDYAYERYLDAKHN